MTPTTTIAKVNTVRVLQADPLATYERNLRASLKAVEAAAVYNPALLGTQLELAKALNTHLKATASLSKNARAAFLAQVVS